MTKPGKKQVTSESQGTIDQIIHGYRKSNILFSAYETGILPFLADHNTKLEDLSHKLKISEDSAKRIVLALLAMGLVRRTKELYRLKVAFRPLFSIDSTDNIGPMIQHEIHLQKRWINLSESIRNGKPLKKKEENLDPRNRKRFIAAMSNIGHKSAKAVVDKIHIKGEEKILDLAGGPGVYLQSFCEKYPNINVVLMDLPDTIMEAKRILKKHPEFDRMDFISGDMFDTDFGKYYDIIFISNAIHIFKNSDLKFIFKKCNRSLKNGGRILVKDFYLNNQETGPEFSTIFSIHMLISSDGGRCYTENDIYNLFACTGFSRGKKIKISENSLILEGIKK